MNTDLKNQLKPYINQKLTEDKLEGLVNVITTAAFKARSSKGGKKGGDARASSLTPERRTAIAKNAVEKRWTKKKKLVDNS